MWKTFRRKRMIVERYEDDMDKSVNIQKKERNSAIELFRILCLVLIFWMHGSSNVADNQVGILMGIFASTIGNMGVSCFILITGYFGLKLDAKKMIKLDLMLMFYCWIGLFFQQLWGANLGMEEKLTYIFPVIGKRSWYFTCYFILAFLSPFLNELIEKLGELRLKQLIVTMLIIFSGVTTFCFFDVMEDGGKGIVHMILLYLIGRYIGMYKEDNRYPTGKLTGIFVGVLAVNFALNAALYLVTGSVQNRFARDNTLFTIAEAVCAFLIFKNIHFENKCINRISRYVPAIFIMEWTLRGIIWNYLIPYLEWIDRTWYVPFMLVIAVLLVVMGSVIDQIRRVLLGGVEERLGNLIYNILYRIYERWFPHA